MAKYIQTSHIRSNTMENDSDYRRQYGTLVKMCALWPMNVSHALSSRDSINGR